MAAGLHAPRAEQAARRAFGNVTLTNERGRAVWRWALARGPLGRPALCRSSASAYARVRRRGHRDARHRHRREHRRFQSRRRHGAAAPCRSPNRRSADVGGICSTRREHASDVARLLHFLRVPPGAASSSGSRRIRETGITLTGGDAPLQLAGEIVGWDLFDDARREAGHGPWLSPGRGERRAPASSSSATTCGSTAFAADPAIVGQRRSRSTASRTRSWASRRRDSAIRSPTGACRSGRRWRATPPRGRCSR